MENSINNNKYKDQRPGVSEEQSSKKSPGENERGRADCDGPFKGVQSARGLVSESNSINEAQSLCRILISKDASLALDEASAKVVDGFDGGHITRAQIASWWILKSAERMTVTDIKEIRAAYFDKIAYLENLLKRAKETGIAPAELDAICPGTGGTVVSRRKYRRRPKAATPPCT